MDVPQPRRKIRPPRATLWDNTSAVLRLENGRQLWAKAVRISITGGLLEFANYLDEGVKVSLTVYLSSHMVRGKAAMLFPTRAGQGYLQPFRFTDLRDQECRALETEIRELLQQNRLSAPGLRPSRPPQESL